MDADCNRWCKEQSDMFDYGQWDEERERCACIMEVLLPQIRKRKNRLPMRYIPAQTERPEDPTIKYSY